MNTYLLDVKAKVRREDIFKSTTGNKYLHEISISNGFIVVNFIICKNLIVRNPMFSQI
jgi:hypothetical protein